MSTAPSPLLPSSTGAWPHLADARYPTPLAAELADEVLERFLRYVQVDTQSDSDSETFPSTAKQLDLGRMLADELREAGLEEVELTGDGYVFATLAGSAGPTVGLLAHMDTSADESGTDVKPQVVRNYDGGDIVLPGIRARCFARRTIRSSRGMSATTSSRRTGRHSSVPTTRQASRRS